MGALSAAAKLFRKPSAWPESEASPTRTPRPGSHSPGTTLVSSPSRSARLSASPNCVSHRSATTRCSGRPSATSIKRSAHALAAYKWAWADGEPFVHRYELTKTTELLRQLNVPIPNLPPYDPAKDEPLPWEADVRAAIEKLRAEKQKELKE